MGVQRFDTTSIRKYDTTSQGFLSVPARLTRVGIFEYKDASGKVTRELRPPEEVFNEDSLATLSSNPITDLHPESFVTPENAKDLTVGFTSETARKDGSFVAATLRIHHAPTIKAVQDGNRKEISCGYTCTPDLTPGVWNGQHYDSVQRNIRYNHVALGPAGWGRAGSDVSIRLDSDSAICTDIETSVESGVIMSFTEDDKKRLDGELADYKSKLSEVETELGKVQAEREVLTKRLDSYLAKEREASRNALEDRARKVLGAEVKFDGKSDREVREAAILKMQPETKLDGCSDDFIAGAFEYVTSAIKADSSKSTFDGFKSAAVKVDSDRKSPEQVRADAIAKRNSQWKLNGASK